MTAESLTRLMGLAGESLVQTHRLPPLVDSLWQLKGRQTGLLESLQLLEDRVSSREAPYPLLSGSCWPVQGGSLPRTYSGSVRRSRQSRSMPESVKTFPAGCTTKYWPAGCGR